MFPKNKTNKRESSGTFHASSQSQPKNEDKKTAGTKAKENAVVEHRVQEKPDLIIRSMLESPDTQRTLSRDDTELTTVTSNHPSLGTGTVHTPGDSPVTEAEDEDMAQTGGLGDLIFDNMKDSKLTSGQFLPEGLLDRFLTEKSVRRELTKNNISPDDVDDLVAFAVHRAPKIFATLLQADYQGDRLLTAMQYFRKYAIGDEFLPITEENRSRVPFLVNQEWLWTKRAEKIFCEKQWAFRAAELPPRSADEMILKLDANAILPFVKAERSDSGAFGDVYRVLPSESNIRLAKLKGREMAVKYLKDQYPKGDRARLKQYDDWTREVETHHKIKHLGHPHIVEFIAAIERGEERYLVFLWADQGNLLSFWTNHPSPRISVTLVEAVVRQIQGLSEALDKLHNYNKEPGAGAESSVRHGDLKPENILSQSTQGRQPSAHEPDIGTLMIADLGLAKLHAVGTNVRDRTSTRATTWRYQPPEVETLKQKGRSRRYDIWSMGCVILEFVIWLRYGNEALRVFNANIVRVTRPGVVINIENGTESPWFEVLHDHDQTQKAQLHPIVEQTMNFMLENDPEFKGDTALRDIFHLVRDRLLVVELGQSNSQERTGAGTGSNSPTTSMTSIQSTSHVEGGTPFAQTSWNEQVIDPPEKDLPVPGISIVIDGVEELRMLRSEQPYSQSSHNTRAKSEELNATLLEILEKGRNNRGYWYSGTPDVMLDMNKIREAAGISSPSGFLSPDAARNAGGRGLAAQSAQAREVC
ncbi:unnamed protein product [Sordaria macrospora k-hell]|uniref:WGS project CABT00000000 data, contig 2.21 n=2 Tax=Sordaria macrospora TaxID=5147 RepID=F7W278_SORMK|nr:uncharacterized protein SMAC_04710 [Sordaria macrospora k-hell]KAH7630904.1 kinase-like domain-containing protein [Sordaria sp. MPI-SDFR-AT-0083]CCC11728.1 unnamed protein product [Sordaria macrospora k-hell]